MIVNMASTATPDEINHVIDRIRECGFQAHVIHGEERTVIGAVGNSNRRSEIAALRAAPITVRSSHIRSSSSAGSCVRREQSSMCAE
jgi:hypothetical protein